MADLKTTIAQTENLKNKVKLAKQRINETVVRGGGITSKSLSEIPDNIKSMISKNYKKIAIINMNQKMNNGYYGKPTLPMNLSFTPKILLVGIITSNNNTCFVHSSYNRTLETCINQNRGAIRAYIESFSNQNVVLYLDLDGSQNTEGFQIIAIE